MTRETTSLAAHGGLRAEFARYLGFVRAPALPAQPPRGAGLAPAAVLRMLAIDLGAMSALVALAAIAMAAGGQLPRTALAGIEIDWQVAAMVVIVAPVAEEVLFRGWLSGKPGHVTGVLLLLGGLLAAAAIGARSPLVALLVVFAAVAGALVALLGLRSRPPILWFRAIFPVLFWLSTLGFALVHLFNFDDTNLAAVLPLVLPQFILGTMLGYLRVHHGLPSAMALHALHNGLIVGVVLLAGSGAS